MNNPDKYKPLSAEELFKLLDKTSSKANDFDELDDFEKEALEGFSVHSDAQKAKALTDELNMAISKKATEATKGDSKNRIIWFSAAASIVLIIMLSVFFFNQTKEDSVSNIALNESKEDQVPETTIPGSATIESTNAISDTKDIVLANEPILKNSLNDQELGFSKHAEGERLAGGVSAAETTAPSPEYRSENKPDVLLSEKAAKDEAKNKNDLDVDDLKKQGDMVSDNLETKKKEKITLAQEQAREESMELQSVNTTFSSSSANNSKGTKEEDGYYKADADKTVATKKSLEKERVTKPVSSSYDKSNSITETTPGKAPSVIAQGTTAYNNNNLNNNETSNIGSSNNKSDHGAYYVLGGSEIRNTVLDYFKDKSLATPIGKYKVYGVVDSKGKFNVSSITKISEEDCKCVENIERALNGMKKWNSANQDGKDVSSNVEFNLEF